MQLIFLLLWIIAAGIWLTVIYFIRTQLRTIDEIRPRVTWVYLAMIVSSVIFFAIALMNIINYQDIVGSRAPTTVAPQPQSSTSPRSSTNEKIY